MTNIVHENGVETAPDSVQSVEGFQTLLSACGVAELNSRAKIKLSGKDRVRWLNGMITNNIRDLAVGHGVYGFLLNPQGRIQGDLYAFQHPEALIVDTDRRQFENILTLFRRYIIMDKVEVADITDTFAVLQVTGNSSLAVLKAAGFEFPDLQPLQFVTAQWNGAPVTVVRDDMPVLPSYQLWYDPTSQSSVLEALVRSGATTINSGSFELLRIALGIPRVGQDIRDRDLPQETGQARALNFAKGCYIGQEIVERIRSRGNVHRTFQGFLIEGPLPSSGTAIEIEGKNVGEVTSAASLPHHGGEQKVALGYLRREFATPGNKILIGNTNAEVASLPFTKFFQQ